MNKTVSVAAFISIGVLGYVLGVSHSPDSHNHDERSVLASQTEATPTDWQHNSSSSYESLGHLENKISSGTTDSQQRFVSESESKPANDAAKFERLFVENSDYFNGAYTEIAVKDEKYPNAIEHLTSENGISHWGTAREKDTLKLLQTDRLKNLRIESYECRTQTCLIRGSASSHEEAYRIFEDYQNVQQWGFHFGGQEDKSGRYVFYLASFKQEK